MQNAREHLAQQNPADLVPGDLASVCLVPLWLHKAGFLGISQMRSLIPGRIYKNVNDQSQTLVRENVPSTLNLYFRPDSRKSQYFFIFLNGCS